MAFELAREGKVAADAAPGSGRVPRVGSFAFMDVCATVVNAALALSVGVDDRAGGLAWFDVDRGMPEFRLARGGCSRVAVPVPERSPRIAAVRVRASERSRPAEAPSRASLQRLRVFTLDDRTEPEHAVVEWSGDRPLGIGDAWTVLPVTP